MRLMETRGLNALRLVPSCGRLKLLMSIHVQVIEQGDHAEAGVIDPRQHVQRPYQLLQAPRHAMQHFVPETVAILAAQRPRLPAGRGSAIAIARAARFTWREQSCSFCCR